MKKQKAVTLIGSLVCTLGFSAVTQAAVPMLSVVSKVPNPTADITPNFTFKSTVAGTIAYGGDCRSSKTSAIAGNNTLTFGTLKSGNHYNCTIRVINSAGISSAALAVPGFMVSYSPEAVISVVTQEDHNNDGNVDAIVTSTFDANGHSVKESLQKTVDGAVKITELNVYDSHGNILSAKLDENEDGKYEDVTKTINTYDDMGNLVKRQNSVIVKGISYPAGKRSYVYNAKNNITTEYVSGEGEGAYAILYTYNSMGKLGAKKTDFNNDGLNDKTVSFTYDANGNLVSRKTSIFYSALTCAVNFTYNTSNRITKVWVTSNSSKIPKAILSVAYASGVPVSYKLDENGDGVIDEAGTYKITGSGEINNIISGIFESI